MSDLRILDMVNTPADLKALTNEELSILACEIREDIVETTAKTGGHMASSLGTVETILVTHSLLNCPKDKFIFDVGHQAYAHKLVTGRRDAFETLRQFGGISGFPKPDESPYDVHPSGHASDSLSIALGLAKARDLRGGKEKVVALIGDASLSGGMAFEALNEIGHEQTPMVIILNDNAMSISRNVGGLMKHLGRLRTSAQYRQARDSIQAGLEERGGFLGKAIVNFGRNAKESMKQFAIPHTMIFEQLGILCTTPVDGHNIKALKETLEVALAADGPVLVHVITKKGAGYIPAEKNPEKFHGVSAFDITTGEIIKPKIPKPASYTQVFGQALVKEAEADKNIVAITAAMKGGTGLNAFSQQFPDRFVDVGISEEHAVGLAAGLAAGGKKPVVAIYSTFMQRTVDQMIVDVALPKFNVVFAIDRAGVVGEDGPTHHGVFDLVFLRMIPHMKVLAPSNEAELVSALHTALRLDGPVALRYPRGVGEGVDLPRVPETFEVGKSHEVRTGEDVAILAFGRMLHGALGAADILEKEGISARVVDMRWVKPLDIEAIKKTASTKLVVTVEEGVIAGGVGEAVLSELAKLGAQTKVINLGFADEFVPQGKVDELLAHAGLDAQGIAASIRKAL